MKDTTGSTSKKEHITKKKETIANNENSAILCKSSFAYVYKDIGYIKEWSVAFCFHVIKFILDKAQANIVSTQSTINSATSDFSKENTIIQGPGQRSKTTDNIFGESSLSTKI